MFDFHAWCEVYLPGAGWIGLDPTSGLLTDEGHIPLACTPEPSSAAAISGESQKAEVDFTYDMQVTRVEEKPDITWQKNEGKPFLRFQSPNPGKMVMLYREIALPAGVKGLEITLRYRTKGVLAGEKPWFDARTIFHFLNDERTDLPPEFSMIFEPETSDWKESRRKVLVPENATILQMMPCLFQVTAGTLDLGEIRVIAMDKAEPESIMARKVADKAREAERAAILQEALQGRKFEMKAMR